MEEQEGALVARAEAARQNVANQLGTLIEESGMTGSPTGIAVTVLKLREAEQSGDPDARRAAAMEIALAAACYAVHLDLSATSGGTLRV